MTNEQIVRESIRRKFANKGISAPSENRKVQSYEEAQKAGNVRDMLYHKLGVGEVLERKARREQEYSTQDITTWVSELRTIDEKIKAVRGKIDRRLEALKEELIEEKREQEKRLFQKGVSRGSMKHLLFEGDYKQKELDLSQNDTIKALQKDLGGLYERKDDLNYYVNQFKADNAEEINALKREQVRQNIIAAGLLDD